MASPESAAETPLSPYDLHRIRRWVCPNRRDFASDSSFHEELAERETVSAKLAAMQKRLESSKEDG